MAEGKGRSLGARRGGRARSLHDMAAHDQRLLDPSSTKTRDRDDVEPDLEEAGQGTTEGVADTVPDSSPGDGDTDTSVVEDPPGDADSDPTVGEESAGVEPSAEQTAAQSVRKPPRADFRDALQLMSWTTTQDLWDRYSGLALALRKQTGVKVKTTQLIRAVVESNFPDTSSRAGVSKLAGYADRWSAMRARSKHVQKAQNIHLTRRSIESLERAQVALLEDRGQNVAVGRMVSGLANEHFPSAAEAKALLDIS